MQTESIENKGPFIVQKVDSLPTPYQSEYEARIVYNYEDGKMYCGGVSGWELSGSGYSGYSGVGYSGASGYSGNQGYSGYSGITGNTAASGYSGRQGTSGYSGNSGTSGISGYSGISGSGNTGTVPQNSQPSDYTLQLSDVGKCILMTDSVACSLNVPNLLFPIDSRIDIIQVGAGKVTIVAGGGVTINSNGGLSIAAQYVGVTLVNISSNSWILVGNLTT